jgi:hypothetical protein
VRGCLEAVAGDDAAVLRPPEMPDGDAELSMEVERERVRVTATEDIAAARAAAERGENAEAARILEGEQEAVRRSAPGMAGDPTCAALEDELRDLGARAANRMEYEQTGRAAMLAGMSSHRQQRALSVAVRPAQFGLRVRGRGARRRYGGPRRRSGTAAVRDSGDAEHGEDLAERARAAATYVVAGAAGEEDAFTVCRMIYSRQILPDYKLEC